MNLREKLKIILPTMLPANSAEAIKGTELIRLVKHQLKSDYSDATLRYHFSIMCCDPVSPIAKVEQGQGYYLRSPAASHFGSVGHVTTSQAKLGLWFENQTEVLDIAMVRQLKLRAIYARDVETTGKFSFLFESSFSDGAPYENVWKCPEVAVLNWEAGDTLDHTFKLNPKVLDFKRRLGVDLFSITSAKLKLQVTYNSYREDFYQALANSSWAHAGELVIAAPIDDEQLVEDLRELGTTHGIGISTLGLQMDELDELPSAMSIPQMSAREFEALQYRLKKQKISSPRAGKRLNWSVMEKVRQDNADFHSLFQWLERCLQDSRAYTFGEFARIENGLEDGDEE